MDRRSKHLSRIRGANTRKLATEPISFSSQLSQLSQASSRSQNSHSSSHGYPNEPKTPEFEPTTDHTRLLLSSGNRSIVSTRSRSINSSPRRSVSPIKVSPRKIAANHHAGDELGSAADRRRARRGVSTSSSPFKFTRLSPAYNNSSNNYFEPDFGRGAESEPDFGGAAEPEPDFGAEPQPQAHSYDQINFEDLNSLTNNYKISRLPTNNSRLNSIDILITYLKYLKMKKKNLSPTLVYLLKHVINHLIRLLDLNLLNNKIISDINRLKLKKQAKMNDILKVSNQINDNLIELEKLRASHRKLISFKKLKFKLKHTTNLHSKKNLNFKIDKLNKIYDPNFSLLDKVDKVDTFLDQL